MNFDFGMKLMKTIRKSYLILLSTVAIGVLFMFITGFKKNDTKKNESNGSQATNGIVVDIDGNVYHTIKIGSQIWMTENLKVTHYRDGSSIQLIGDSNLWSASNSGAYCWYDNNPATYKDTHGALYNFYVVVDKRNLCPKGWHVPSESEWLALEAYLGGRSLAGGKMKEAGFTHWQIPNTGATNESGFLAIPSGGRARKGWFGSVGEYATWWSSTSMDSTSAFHWGLSWDNAFVRTNAGHKASGFSIRCLKD